MTKQKNAFISVALMAMIGGAIFFHTDHCQAAPPPPPPRERLEDTLANMDLSADQRQKVDAAYREMQGKERQLREDFRKQMAAILSPEQMQKLEQSDRRPPAPPRDGQGDRAPASSQAVPNVAPSAAAKDVAKGTVIFTGGFDTDPRDHGRPVVLVAAALGVPSDVFRKAFSGVTPASAGNEPQPDQVRKNKAALMKVLEPYGITNDQLDAASNAYRYNKSKGEMWKTTPAAASAVITNGTVTGFTITNPGAGYSSPPTLTVAGYEGVHATVELTFSTDTKINGSIKSITIDAAKK